MIFKEDLKICVIKYFSPKLIFIDLLYVCDTNRNFNNLRIHLYCFEDVFSKVYGAAVLEGDFQMKMPEDVGLVSGMNYPVNMMESAGKDLISIIYATAVDKYTASGNNDEHYLHVVIAVNKLKKYL